MSVLSFKSIPPVWGVNYNLGWIGFLHHLEPDFVSSGIAIFQGPPAYGDIIVTHALVVTGTDLCTEALPSGVKATSLSRYFDDPTVAVVFRKPRGWHPVMGKVIADEANAHIGDKYAYSLIVAQALSHCWLGKKINKWFKDRPDAWVSKLLDYGRIEFCSMHAAKSLQAVAELAQQGILQKDARTIDVQELFGSRAVFEEWR